MKKKNLRPLILSSLTALAMAGIGTGATFALFTDKAETAISAKAGIVDVGLTPSGLTTYSAEANAQGDRIDERGSKYISKLTEVEGTFTNGGTASFADGALTMRKLTPGDRVTFEAGLVNHSNVAIKYRLVYKFTGTSGVLAQGLVTKTNISGSAQTYEGLKEFVAPWTFLEAGAALPAAAITFDIELPISRGNEYQNKDASFSFYVEAVQGNAYVEDDPKTLVFGELTPTQEAEQEVVDPAQPTVLQTTSELATTTVKTTIPANTSYQTESEPTDNPIMTDDTVKLVVSDLVIAEDSTTKKGTIDLDISLLVNDVAVSQFSEFVNVEVKVGKNLDITSVTHNGDAVTGYTYTASEGILRFTTKNFSPFTVEYSIMPNTSYGFFDSYVKDGHWVHEIKTTAHFKNIDVHLRKAYPGADYTTDPTVNDSTAVYVLCNDVNFNNAAVWTAEELASQASFTGTLDGQGYTLKNAAVSSETKGIGLFKTCEGNVTVKNITFDHVSVGTSSGDGVAGIVFGTAKNAIDGGADSVSSILKYDHVTINDTCELTAEKNSGSLIGNGRGYHEIQLHYCTNYMDINGTTTNNGGFIGSGAYTHRFVFDHCVNEGDVRGSGFIGGFAGQIHTASSYTINDCVNRGDIVASGNNPSVGWFGALYSDTDNVSGSGNINEGIIKYSSGTPAVADKTLVTNGIISVASGVADDYIQNAAIADLAYERDADGQFVFTEVEGATSYKMILKITAYRGFQNELDPTEFIIYDSSGITTTYNFASFAEFQSGAHHVDRAGYVMDESVTKINSSIYADNIHAGTGEDAYVINGRGSFFRMDSTNPANPTTYDTIIQLDDGEYAFLHQVNLSAENDIIFNPMGANVEYWFYAYNGTELIATSKHDDYVGSGTVLKNMSGMSFNVGVNYSQDANYPHFDYVA